MLWVAIVLIVGCVIVLLDYTLESIVVWLQRRGIVKSTCYEWFSNDTLQLQRLAHEELGLGDWEGCTGPRVIPVTKKGQLLGILDYEDPKHPRLVRPAEVVDEYGSAENTDSSTDQEGKTENINHSVHEEPLLPERNGSDNEPSASSVEALSSEATRISVTAPAEGVVAAQTQSPVQSATQSPVQSSDHLQEQSPNCSNPTRTGSSNASPSKSDPSHPA